MILDPTTAAPRCTATVDLLSKAQRPYIFSVTVTGEPPHSFVRRYHVQADSDTSAAMKGMELFIKECNPVLRAEMETLAPKAKLQ